jgi:aminomethyltransferase
MLKRTPLHAAHQKLGARLIEFGGWDMPVQYTGILDEHLAVRNAAGIFDICHMGEVFVDGPAALEFLNLTLTNDIRKLQPGQGQYTILCNERGTAIDDLYAYRLGAESFLLVINASRIDNDVPWLEKCLKAFPKNSGVRLVNKSDVMGAVAVQGPKTPLFIDAVVPATSGAIPASQLKKNEIGIYTFAGQTIYVSRTGYTGEDGFEIVIPGPFTEALWNKVLEAGAAFGIKPAGLGARDTLRTEVCYPLYGHELDENTTPLDAGLGWVVSLDKGEFNGRSVLADQKAKGVSKKLIAYKMTDKSAPPRPHYAIWSPGSTGVQIGDTTSGTQSPSLSLGIGLGYVKPEFAKTGTPIEIEIRGKRFAAVVVGKPIYRKPAA